MHAYTHDYTQTLKEIEFSLLVELGRKCREWRREVGGTCAGGRAAGNDSGSNEE